MSTTGTVTPRENRSGRDRAIPESTEWRKSIHSGHGGDCVEVRRAGSTIQIRDSKYLRDSDNDPRLQPIITVTRDQWATFLEAVTSRSTATTTEPRITVRPEGSVTLTALDGTELEYRHTEWEAFTRSAAAGEFDNHLSETTASPPVRAQDS